MFGLRCILPTPLINTLAQPSAICRFPNGKIKQFTGQFEFVVVHLIATHQISSTSTSMVFTLRRAKEGNFVRKSESYKRSITKAERTNEMQARQPILFETSGLSDRDLFSDNLRVAQNYTPALWAKERSTVKSQPVCHLLTACVCVAIVWGFQCQGIL